MVQKKIRIGSMVDIHSYDDGDYDAAIETEAPIKTGAPVDANDVLRVSDITDGALSDGDQLDIDYTPSNYTPDDTIGEADDDHDLAAHLKGIDDALASISAANWPVGSVFLAVVSTNPNVLLGFGTWSQIAQGQFLVGFSTGDSDFDPVENTGGAKTHGHMVDINSTTSGGPSSTVSVDNNADGSTVDVADDSHTHDTNPSNQASGPNDALPPFFVVYVWKRTA